MPRIQTQVVYKQQMHQLPLLVIRKFQSQQNQLIQQQAIKTFRTYSTYTVCYLSLTTLSNDVIPHAGIYSCIQLFNIFKYSEPIIYYAIQEFNMGEMAVQLWVDPYNIFGNQMAQYQLPSSQSGQVTIVQYQPQPLGAEILQPVLQTIKLQQTQSVWSMLIPVNERQKNLLR
ncbi:uncharacterized protein LOC100575979 [Acyrthosiphon pisum]|uniref:Uncharacterized protein n=1 Tax=Acyrthosiphon pisum TaxID=7029 RepID=A0A8R2JQY9_ACYPI|nr:uncharacterized protein LOC100575979 [Acyrthosiphon pisum]|eukprot:XP_016662344.1 PREDICTED: uncharacterized protein LOC100575979 isoform X2 [Acyrthosiphon pisum]